MAYKLLSKEWIPHLNDYKHEYVADTVNDIADLPKCAVSSSAIVVSTGAVYMVNASGNWVEFGG